MELQFAGEVFYWRGPSPYHYVAVPEPQSAEIAAIAPAVSYGWGVIPVTARVGDTEWTTSLFPKDGGYLVPVKDAVRRAEDLALGDTLEVSLTIRS